MEEAATLVTKYGGSLSGEHGDGQSKAEFLYKMFGPELIEAFRELKRLWDPEWKMNPGKVVDPYWIDENLRLGTNYQPPEVNTQFHFLQDGNSFAHATLRCVGVGECRRQHKHTMCPSYRVTLEEKHSTRGRAHVLFEMMQGEVIKDGWKSQEVFDTLDLCLSCKGCKHDCPVNVDMAAYKAEFLSHYYQNRLRPRHAYAMGWINLWAWAASPFPEIANFMTQAPGLNAVAKLAGGVAPERQMPRFARQTFQSWFRHRPRHNPDGPKVLLWADTFNNYFHPALPRQPPKYSRLRAIASSCRRYTYAVAAPSTITDFSTWPPVICVGYCPWPRDTSSRHSFCRPRAELPCGVSRRADRPSAARS
jgi:ferredoxin